jgi:hypothetical protein
MGEATGQMELGPIRDPHRRVGGQGKHQLRPILEHPAIAGLVTAVNGGGWLGGAGDPNRIRVGDEVLENREALRLRPPATGEDEEQKR